METTSRVREILSWYPSDNPGTLANIYRLLMSGRLAGTGKLVILPVDQGFEHGPARSFAPNPAAYDPHYHFKLALGAGLSAYAAPLGMIEAGVDTFAGAVPTILKLNSSNSLATTKDQAHRIYLRDGIFAEVTLRFQDKAFEPWPWTYADYRQPGVLAFLQEAREFYHDRLRASRSRPSAIL